MKIEIGESLCSSWLKHVKGCQIVQMNWKPSCFWQEGDADFVKEVLVNIDQYFVELGHEIFPRKMKGKEETESIDPEQIIRSVECDIVGVRFDNKGCVDTVYAYESAFHSDGLHYRNGHKKVAAKIVKAVLALYLHFGAKKFEIGFMTPIVKDSVASELKKVLDVIRNYFAQGRIKEKLLCNVEVLIGYMSKEKLSQNGFKSLYKQVVYPLMVRVPFMEDDNELFMRAMLAFTLGIEEHLPGRSNLRTAYRMLGMPIEKIIEGIDQIDTKCLTPNGRSALNVYKRWIKEGCLLKSKCCMKNDFTEAARRVPNTEEVRNKQMRQTPQKGARNGL